jgi:hypothetical protein
LVVGGWGVDPAMLAEAEKHGILPTFKRL